MKTLLVPTDFSENASHALRFATEFAREKGSPLVVLHVYQVPFDYASREEENAEIIGHFARKKLSELQKQYEENETLKGLKVKFIAISGEPVYGILHQAVKEDAEMIIMGVSGSGAIKNALMGNTTFEVARLSKVPVLAVPKHSSLSGISKFLFSVDYHERDLATIKKLVPLAEACNSGIDIVHVAEKDTLYERILFRGFQHIVKEEIGFKDLSFDLLVNSDFHKGISEFLLQAPESVLVMTHYKRSFPSMLFSKSVTEAILQKATMPVLVFNVQ